MRNNLKALILHFIIITLSFIFLIILVATGPKLVQYADNTIIRILIGMLYLFIYIFSGTLLDINKSKKYDFLVGSSIGLIGIVIWFYTFSITGKNLYEIPKELSEFWIPMNIYNMAFTIIKLVWDIPYIPLLSLISNLIPTFLMGLGLRYKRKKSYFYG
ncbi:MAG: hypothetical protein RIN55_09840 [Tissierellaceae bacterium]|nr:hypothetical protein [Tissierellaceae bacterium]